jgi:hypothetical protein
MYYPKTCLALFKADKPEKLNKFHSKFLSLLNFLWFNTPQLAAECWGCGRFVPPHAPRLKGKIFDTPELARGFFISG